MTVFFFFCTAIFNPCYTRQLATHYRKKCCVKSCVHSMSHGAAFNATILRTRQPLRKTLSLKIVPCNITFSSGQIMVRRMHVTSEIAYIYYECHDSLQVCLRGNWVFSSPFHVSQKHGFRPCRFEIAVLGLRVSQISAQFGFGLAFKIRPRLSNMTAILLSSHDLVALRT